MTDECFEALRPKLFGVAYRMLGEVGGAEDAVQEAYLRWHRETSEGRTETIASPEAYLVTVVTRICIDELRSARARREQYVGEWLPEPLLSDESRIRRARSRSPSRSRSRFSSSSRRSRPSSARSSCFTTSSTIPYERIAEILDKSGPAVRQAAVRGPPARRRAQAALRAHDPSSTSASPIASSLRSETAI